MPTSTVSSRLSDAVYLVSIIGLSILLARPVYLVLSASQERSAEVVATGLGSMIDSMSPGTSVVTSLESYPAVQLSVTLSGTTVAASFGKSTATAQVRWSLPQATLHPGETYRFHAEGRRDGRLRRRGMVDAYIEVCIALLMLASMTLLALSIVLSHIALGG